MQETNELIINRPSWDEYFLKIAEVVATRATCPRAMIGAVITKDQPYSFYWLQWGSAGSGSLWLYNRR